MYGYDGPFNEALVFAKKNNVAIIIPIPIRVQRTTVPVWHFLPTLVLYRDIAMSSA